MVAIRAFIRHGSVNILYCKLCRGCSLLVVFLGVEIGYCVKVFAIQIKVGDGRLVKDQCTYSVSC